MKKYWFKPKQFWKWFAAYYPVTKEGWIVTIGAIGAILLIFTNTNLQPHSLNDLFFKTAPGIIVVFLIFDIISFRIGEYPAWWKKYHENNKN